MRIATAKLFARHTEGFVELWVMGEDGVRPAKPSDFISDDREMGDLGFSGVIDSGSQAATGADAQVRFSDALALASHLKAEARRMSDSELVADEAVALAAIEIVGREHDGLPALLASLVGVR